jgi:hypothetical protein
MVPYSYVAFGNVSSATSTAAIDISKHAGAAEHGRNETMVQVEKAAGATASIDVETRLDSSLSWVKVETAITANKIIRIGAAKEVRLTVTSYSGSGNIGGGVLV